MSEAPQKYPRSPQGSACWIEIPARDLQKLQDFYSAVFPKWTFKQSESAPHVVQFSFPKPENMGGGLVKMPEQAGPATEQVMGTGLTVYFMVDSIDESHKSIEAAGGKNVLPKMPQAEDGFFANYVDVEGNRFGIYEMHPDKIAD